MATITTTRTSLVAAAKDATGTVSNVKIGANTYAINDATARESVTAINTYLGEVASDLTAINTETAANTAAIGTAADASSASTVYGAIKKHTEDVNTAIGTKGTAGDTVYGAIKANTDAIGTSADTAGTATVYGAIATNANGITSINTAIGTKGDAATQDTVYGAIKANSDAIANLKTATSAAFIYIGSVETLPTGSATDQAYSKSGDTLTFGSGSEKLAVGNVINVKNNIDGTADGMNYVWNGAKWDALGTTIAAATNANNGFMTSTQVSELESAYKASYDASNLALNLQLVTTA